MITLTIEAKNPSDLRDQLNALLGEITPTDVTKVVEITPVENPPLVEVPKTEVKPVITMEQAAEAVATAPVHEEPKQPTLEEVRAALKALRDKKGAAAVKELLKAYGANSVPELKPEDYLGAHDRALMEVG